MPTDAQGDKIIVINPAPRLLASDWKARVQAASPIVWVSVTILVVVVALSNPHLIGWLAALVVIVLVFAVPNLAARANARLILTADLVVYRGPLRVVKKCPRSEVTRLVRLRLAALGPRFPLTRLLFLNNAGHTILSLPEEWWSSEDIERVKLELGAPFDTVSEPLAPAEANRRFPGAASFALEHRFAIGAVGLLIFGLIFFGVLGALVGSGHQ